MAIERVSDELTISETIYAVSTGSGGVKHVVDRGKGIEEIKYTKDGRKARIGDRVIRQATVSIEEGEAHD